MAASSSISFPWDRACTSNKHGASSSSQAGSTTAVPVLPEPSLERIEDAFTHFIHETRQWLDRQRQGESSRGSAHLAPPIPVDVAFTVGEVKNKAGVTFSVTLAPRSSPEVRRLGNLGMRLFEVGLKDCLTHAERFNAALAELISSSSASLDRPASLNMRLTEISQKIYGDTALRPRILAQEQWSGLSLGIQAPDFTDDEMSRLIELLLSLRQPFCRLDLSGCEELRGHFLKALQGLPARNLGFLRLADCAKLNLFCVERELEKSCIKVLELEGGGREYLQLARERLSAKYILGIKYANDSSFSNYRGHLQDWYRQLAKILKSSGDLWALAKKREGLLYALTELELGIELALTDRTSGALWKILQDYSPNLMSVRVSEVSALSDESLNALALSGTRLKEIRLNKLAKISHAGILALAERMPALASIHVTGCSKVKFRTLKRGLDQLKRSGKVHGLRVTTDSGTWEGDSSVLPFPI